MCQKRVTACEAHPLPLHRLGSTKPFQLVGTARFELATPCSQSRCATRLRHVPGSCRLASVRDAPGRAA
jgi:hypothetical protein